MLFVTYFDLICLNIIDLHIVEREQKGERKVMK